MKKLFILIASSALLASCSSFDVSRLIADKLLNDNANHDQASDRATPADTKPAKPAKAEGEGRSEAPKSVKGKKIDTNAVLDKYRSLTTSSKKIPAGADLSKGVPGFDGLKGGEWVAYRITENNTVQGVVKWAVLGKKNGDWLFEFASYNSDGANVLQMTITGLENVYKSGNPDQGTITSLRIKNSDGEITTLDGAMLGMTAGAYKGFLGQTANRYTATVTAGGEISVPAGIFAATWKVKSSISAKKSATEGQAWVSTQVPFTHLVKGVSDDGKTVMELIDFGTSGYVSDLE